MRHFKDSAGREWNIGITVGLIELVRSKLQIDIADMYFETGGRVFGDVVLLVNLLYVVCNEQADKIGITDVQFGEGLVGDAIENAASALMEAIADFFPSRKRKMLEAQLAKAREIEQAVIDKAMTAINELTLEKFLKSLKTSPESSV